MLAPMSTAVALFADASGRAPDVRVSGGHLALDFTPATVMLVALGTDRRADAGDVLPDDLGQRLASPVLANPRRGYVGDALDASGALMGSRLWLLERSKLDDEIVPGLARGYAKEALDGQQARIGAEVSISASRTGVNSLMLSAAAGSTSVTVPVIS